MRHQYQYTISHISIQSFIPMKGQDLMSMRSELIGLSHLARNARRQLFKISLSQPVELCVLHYTAAFDSYRTTISFSIMQYIAFFARQAESRLPPFWYMRGYVMETLLKRLLRIIAGDYINSNT